MVNGFSTQGITDWLGTQGIRVLVIVIVSIVLYFLLRRFVPRLVKSTLAQRMKKQPKGEIKKRTDTLSSAIVSLGAVFIAIFAIITILPEFGVNIAPALAGLGIVGIAVGFGAQSLIKDLLAGIFILLEDQYRVGDVVNIAGNLSTFFGVHIVNVKMSCPDLGYTSYIKQIIHIRGGAKKS